jgi:hypothetical protein
VKTCTKCGIPKSADRFASQRDKRDGLDSWCRDCRNQARRAAYHANLERERQRSRDYYSTHVEQAMAVRKHYYQEHREEMLAAGRARWRGDAAYRAAKQEHDKGRRRHGDYDPAKGRVDYMKRHGGIDEWARMYDAQGGCCYLCGETLGGIPKKLIAVDHDHDCHPSTRARTESCRDCRRGLAHAWCNQLIGLAGENMDVLRAIIANFERVNAQTKERIAARRREQAVLGTDVIGATIEVRVQPMPDLDMPVGATWPHDEGALF